MAAARACDFCRRSGGRSVPRRRKDHCGPAYVLSILSFVELPATLATVSRIVTVVCLVADIITVITSGRITFFAD